MLFATMSCFWSIVMFCGPDVVSFDICNVFWYQCHVFANCHVLWSKCYGLCSKCHVLGNNVSFVWICAIVCQSRLSCFGCWLSWFGQQMLCFMQFSFAVQADQRSTINDQYIEKLPINDQPHSGRYYIHTGDSFANWWYPKSRRHLKNYVWKM